MKKEIITYRSPKSPISEVFRTLRTNIQFMKTKGGLKSLLVTSTVSGEGKSWVSANLAVTFAQAGKRVILVDADMRKGRQFSLFGLPPTPGLSNYLSGYDSNGQESDSDILSYIKETEVSNLYSITSGAIPPNPSELLTSEKTINMVKRLEELCDIVIFDGTPSAIVTDAVILSRFVDSTIIVSSHKTTKIDNLKKLKREIENVGGKIVGVVFNKVPISKKRYESEYYYYGSTQNTKNVDFVPKQVKKESTKKTNTIKYENKHIKKETNITENNDTKKDINTKEKPPLNTQKTDELFQELNQYIETERAKLSKGDKE